MRLGRLYRSALTFSDKPYLSPRKRAREIVISRKCFSFTRDSLATRGENKLIIFLLAERHGKTIDYRRPVIMSHVPFPSSGMTRV
jgi:hypothetical protein